MLVAFVLMLRLDRSNLVCCWKKNVLRCAVSVFSFRPGVYVGTLILIASIPSPYIQNINDFVSMAYRYLNEPQLEKTGL